MPIRNDLHKMANIHLYQMLSFPSLIRPEKTLQSCRGGGTKSRRKSHTHTDIMAVLFAMRRVVTTLLFAMRRPKLSRLAGGRAPKGRRGSHSHGVVTPLLYAMRGITNLLFPHAEWQRGWETPPALQGGGVSVAGFHKRGIPRGTIVWLTGGFTWKMGGDLLSRLSRQYHRRGRA